MKNSSHDFKDSALGYYTGRITNLARRYPFTWIVLAGGALATVPFANSIAGVTLMNVAWLVGCTGTIMTQWPDRVARRVFGKATPEKYESQTSEPRAREWIGVGGVGQLLIGLAVASLGIADVAGMVYRPLYQASMGAVVGGYGSAAGIAANAVFATIMGWAAVNRVSKFMYIRRAKKIVQGAVAEHPELQNAIKIQRVGALGESEVAVQLEMDGATLHPAMEALGFKLPPEVPTDLTKEDVTKMTWVVSFDEKEADTIK